MCTTCGCSPHITHDHDHGHHHGHDHSHPHRTRISIEEDILARNNRLAGLNRALFKEKGILVLNLVSSPGSGKTTLLRSMARVGGGDDAVHLGHAVGAHRHLGHLGHVAAEAGGHRDAARGGGRRRRRGDQSSLAHA